MVGEVLHQRPPDARKHGHDEGEGAGTFLKQREGAAAAGKPIAVRADKIRYDELAPEFQKLIDAMAVGDVTEPIRTTRGYQLLKLEARTERQDVYVVDSIERPDPN